MLEVAMENLFCCLPGWLAQNHSSTTPSACKTYLTCGARDPLSSPPFLPFRVTAQTRSLAVPQPLKVLGGLGDLPVAPSV